MKTPRQLLLDQHQDAQTRLDEVRRMVLSQLRGREGIPSARRAETPWWLACLVPGRAGWTTLGAAWLLILGFYLGTGSHVAGGRATSIAITKSPEPWLEQRRILAELLDLPSALPPSAATRPRSERRAQPILLCA